MKIPLRSTENQTIVEFQIQNQDGEISVEIERSSRYGISGYGKIGVAGCNRPGSTVSLTLDRPGGCLFSPVQFHSAEKLYVLISTQSRNDGPRLRLGHRYLGIAQT